ncbi:tRNA1Val (adenine37-N6)-methyltransferase [Dysgonomonadaceae bacterium PH5-43]|nr:tRNA1Val (adenine37-N6)-methyltransferase [Dysgonomonadaceae bacterium PH5-43]
MSNPFFHFKKFTVYHNLCAMKVGTDAVLLGAWSNHTSARWILDVGTGSGVIALMLSQRFSDAKVDAIDIDEGAYQQACINFNNSPFKDRLKAFNESFLEFSPQYKYDLIVSNPPYFNNSLLSPNHSRTLARHTTELNLNTLIEKAKSLLNDKGILALVLPYSSLETTVDIANDNGLHLVRSLSVKPMENRPPKRVLLEFSNSFGEQINKELVLELSRHNYSLEYKALTKDFMLD